MLLPPIYKALKRADLLADKVTLDDIAGYVGVSPATASLALSGKGRVAEKTRRAVASAARVLGYARKETQGTGDRAGKTVGILYMVDYRWAFAWVLIQPIVVEIIKSLEAEDYTPVLIPVCTTEDLDTVFHRIIKSGVEAVLPIHYGNQILFIRLEDRGIPVVVVMNSDFQTKYYSVCVDDFQGSYEGCSYLLRLGHKRIAFVDGERKDLPLLSRDRYFGFQKALAEGGVAFPDEYYVKVDFSDAKTIADGVGKLLSLPEPPTALFALDDDLGVRLYDVLQKRGVFVPQDISMIAPGDVLDYRLPHTPPITTMRINTTLMGRITAELLLNRLKHRQEDIHVLKVNQKLVDRGSCRAIGPPVGVGEPDAQHLTPDRITVPGTLPR